MNPFTFRTTSTIHNEFGGVAQFSEHVFSVFGKNMSNKNILFVSDKGILDLGLAERTLESLRYHDFQVHFFSDFSTDPVEASVLSGVAFAKSIKANLIIGFGGGSSMDTAKLIALLALSGENLADIYGVNLAQGKRLPLILVPTTAGTGSEVTPISIVTIGEREKKGVVSPILLPDLALLDASLTLDLPAHVTATTGIDAMVHAIEAYTSINPNNNRISRSLAKEALNLLGANICGAVFNGKKPKYRSGMLLGSLLAGQAFANSPVAAIHALAYPIGGQFHVPHGLSNALVLPHVMRFNLSNCEKQYAELAPLVFPELRQETDSKNLAELFIEKITDLSAKLGLETTLREVGIVESNIDSLAEDSMNQTRLLVNNPRPLNCENAKSIYRKAL